MMSDPSVQPLREWRALPAGTRQRFVKDLCFELKLQSVYFLAKQALEHRGKQLPEARFTKQQWVEVHDALIRLADRYHDAAPLARAVLTTRGYGCPTGALV